MSSSYLDNEEIIRVNEFKPVTDESLDYWKNALVENKG